MAFRLPFSGAKPAVSGDPLAGDETIRIAPHVRAMIDGDGGVLLDLKAGRYYSLNGVGAKIWSRAEKGMTRSQILTDLQQIYQVSGDQLAADLAAFVRAMEEKGLLHAGA
jgi:coenzyme PQQ synthesis protein D (PqqD)